MIVDLFPSIEPYKTGYLKVDDIHEIYWEISGNPGGIPVVFLHGGPGAGATAKHRRFFDPSFYKIIIFDQRGAGRSTPHGEMINNTTPLLLDDMEALRIHLNVDRWVIFGGSWGSTLALCYAIAYPERCMHLILRGIFLCRPMEIKWFLEDVRWIFPDVWEKMVAHIPENERGDLLQAYTKRVMDPRPEVHIPFVKAYSRYEGELSCLYPSQDLVHSYENFQIAFGLARAECHYFLHEIFMGPNYILENADKIQNLSGDIVQGRYDMVCPMRSAWDLKQAWPKVDLHIISDAGHAASEPGIEKALVQATEKFRVSYDGS